jgi:hypothetical protein
VSVPDIVIPELLLPDEEACSGTSFFDEEPPLSKSKLTADRLDTGGDAVEGKRERE